MPPFTSAPMIALLGLAAGATLVGIAPMRKLIQVREARHELRQGSAGRLRTVSGWSVIAFWLLTTLYLATIVGDWMVTQDLGGAVDRSMIRLRIILEILAALSESDS